MKKTIMIFWVLTASLSSYANITATGNAVEGEITTTPAKYSVEALKKSTNPNRPMRIMLTNDDGCRAFGLRELKHNLEAKGYDVWVSAPATNQSGIGTAITFKIGNEFAVEQIDEKSYCFPGTPADATDFGLTGLFKGENAPDLVISGVNDGPNTGMAQVNSGTVGAAVRAMRHGIPAIAASIGIIPFEMNEGFPSTKKYWGDSVEYVSRMVDVIAKDWTPGKAVLPLHSGISINYPAIAKESIKGIKYMENPFNPGPQFSYELLENGKSKQVMDPKVLRVNTEDTDGGWLDQGYIIHTIIDGDWNSPSHQADYQLLLKEVAIK